MFEVFLLFFSETVRVLKSPFLISSEVFLHFVKAYSETSYLLNKINLKYHHMISHFSSQLLRGLDKPKVVIL